MTRTRVGVFVCHCGSNIGGVVNVPRVTEYARTLPYVTCAEENIYSCSDSGLSAIKAKIVEHDLNRVVVTSCTPRTHEELFRRTCEEAGVNRYLFEFVNIREHCSWIHIHEKDAATAKAKELVRIGVSKAVRLRALEMAQANVAPACLVIGGGPAGLSAAASLADQGFKVHLVERQDRLGGLAANLWKLIPGGISAPALKDSLIDKVAGRGNVSIYLNAGVEQISGFVGSFDALIKTKEEQKEIRIGTVIVATGAKELKPLGLYRLGKLDGVLTQVELESAFKSGQKEFGDVVFINCAGARGPDRAYCGRMCCAISIKNARFVKELNPNARVTVLQRDVMAMGATFEAEYRLARQAGVRFIRFAPDRPPEIQGDNKVRGVRVFHQLAGMEVTLPARTTILTTPLVPRPASAELAKMLKVPLDKDGFFLEAHMKLRPVEFATDGVFIAGAARFPATIGESVAQGKAAAAKAAALMFAGEVRVEATTATVEARLCSGCGKCEVICPFGAIGSEPHQRLKGRIISTINSVMCKGCGACAATCPCGAIQQEGFTDAQMHAMVETLALDTEEQDEDTARRSTEK